MKNYFGLPYLIRSITLIRKGSLNLLIGMWILYHCCYGMYPIYNNFYVQLPTELSKEKVPASLSAPIALPELHNGSVPRVSPNFLIITFVRFVLFFTKRLVPWKAFSLNQKLLESLKSYSQNLFFIYFYVSMLYCFDLQ